MKEIPTLLDISPTNLLDLDERDAYRHFFGKSLVEAQELFDQSDFYVNDLGWMGENAFEFYIEAYIKHLERCDAGDLDIAVPMSLVIMRYSMFRQSLSLIGLIEKISGFRNSSIQGDKSFEKKYDDIVRQVLMGSE